MEGENKYGNYSANEEFLFVAFLKSGAKHPFRNVMPNQFVLKPFLLS